ncbi:hypothetical protein Tco_0090538 [Tanacetum coccineum]
MPAIHKLQAAKCPSYLLNVGSGIPSQTPSLLRGMGQMLFPSSVPDTELVLYPLQDKLTSGDKSLDLSAFKLSRLFFSLLSSGSSSCWRSYGAQENLAFSLVLTFEAITRTPSGRLLLHFSLGTLTLSSSSICFLFFPEGCHQVFDNGVLFLLYDWTQFNDSKVCELEWVVNVNVSFIIVPEYRCYNGLGVGVDSDISNRLRLNYVCHGPHVFLSSPPVELYQSFNLF